MGKEEQVLVTCGAEHESAALLHTCRRSKWVTELVNLDVGLREYWTYY